MQEGRERAAVLENRLDEGLTDRVLAAVEEAPAGERARAGVEALVVSAELDPQGTNDALAMLRADPEDLQRLEDVLGLPPRRATLALGAALQLARAELSSADPDLGSRAPELLRWLEGAW